MKLHSDSKKISFFQEVSEFAAIAVSEKNGGNQQARLCNIAQVGLQ
jgi:hypothetical protein